MSYTAFLMPVLWHVLLKNVTRSGEVQCTLVMEKARVAATKVITIPRLELSAAVVAARTASFLKRELEIQDIQEYYWTDSKVVLGYINNNAKRFHVFVANRIQRIRSSTEPSTLPHNKIPLTMHREES